MPGAASNESLKRGTRRHGIPPQDQDLDETDRLGNPRLPLPAKTDIVLVWTQGGNGDKSVRSIHEEPGARMRETRVLIYTVS